MRVDGDGVCETIAKDGAREDDRRKTGESALLGIRSLACGDCGDGFRKRRSVASRMRERAGMNVSTVDGDSSDSGDGCVSLFPAATSSPSRSCSGETNPVWRRP